ncbi:hypothetical protein ACFR9U_06540 [Halorientalis brevis]|uniref:Uncharacterized protein n=1 Tax=Halorientalis brevis TaxID=1126241 RepID=A0ABD6C9U4_9EURY|nr:hypothetical protein [Halorientalis brevis]
MSVDELVTPCPPTVHREPPVPGLERDGDVWRLSVEPYRDLISDVAGVDPTGPLDLQALMTIAARLEGLVARRKRVEDRTRGAAVDQSPTVGAGLSRLWRSLAAVVTALLVRFGSNDATTDGSSPPSFETYSTETVWYLSQFFRAAAEQRRATVAADTASAGDAQTIGIPGKRS